MSALALFMVGLVLRAVAPAQGRPMQCCDYWDKDHPCLGPDKYHSPDGCLAYGACDLGAVQSVEGRDYGTCFCNATAYGGVPQNTSDIHCCFPGTTGVDCEFCTGQPIPNVIKRHPSKERRDTRCWPPDVCNTSVLSHTAHKGLLCDLNDPHLKAMLQAGFGDFSRGTVQTSVQCQGDFLRGNRSEEHFESVQYHCRNSTCECPDCSALVKAIIGAVRTDMYLHCWPNGTCWFWQTELLGGLHINLSCTGSECVKAAELQAYWGSEATPITLSNEITSAAHGTFYSRGIDEHAVCEAAFVLYHDKYFSRPINSQKVLQCEFRNCEKLIQHPTPLPEPSYWMIPFVVVPVFLLFVAGLVLACYCTRLQCRQRCWNDTRSHEPRHIQVTCDDICYTVPASEGRRTILHPISCELQSGRTVAVMGPSGAGKTTFLDIVAGRAKSGTIGGRLLVNGGALASAAALQTYRQYVCAYVMQDDCLPPYLTAAECVLYAAKLRLPVGMPLEEKQERVEEVLQELGLAHVAGTRIGSTSRRGLSGGEMKRVSIAMQMVTRPQMIVLDEPTSGLDSYNAHQVL